MLAAKPWKSDAVARLILSVFVCVYAGSMLVSALHFARAGGKTSAAVFYPLLLFTLGCLGTTLLLLRKTWRLENVMRTLLGVLGCFYAALICGFLAQKLAGPPGNSPSYLFLVMLSFQGAALFLIGGFLREHHVGWAEAFGFPFHWRHALLLGAIAACAFTPIGYGLRELVAWLMEHWSAIHFKPEEQQAIQVLRVTSTWMDRVPLGLGIILLAPVAEEMLFRGILYPWIKQAGYRRLAFWGNALLFAAIHLNLAGLLPLFVLALVLTWLYERTGNLLAPIAAHSLFNAVNFAMLCLGS